MLRRFLALTVLTVLPSSGAAEPQTETPGLRFSDESSVAWVLVPVVVRGTAGHVRKLQRDDFHLRVDGRPVPLMSFEAEPNAPVRLIYLQDLSGSMANGGKLEASRAALRCFLGRSRPGDEYALVTFASGQTSFDVPFTPDTAVLESALATWQGHGTTALHDAVARLPEVRAGDRALKQAAVLVTDGGDNASTLEPQEARDVVRAAELPVYVLDLGAHSAVPDPGSFAHLLRLLASATGGRYRAVYTDPGGMPGGRESGSGDIIVPDGVAEACDAITQDLRYQYVLGFQTRDTGEPAYRKIEVEVDGKKPVKLSHRRGYLGLPPYEAPPVHP